MPDGDYKVLPTRTKFPAQAGTKVLMLPGDKNHTPRPGGIHLVHCVEQDAPGVFEISCTCGQVTWTPWGRDSAGEIAELHLWAVGAPIRTRDR